MQERHRHRALPLPAVRHQPSLAALRAHRDRPARLDPDHLLHNDPTLAVAEPKTLRHGLLHGAARLTRSARRTHLRLDENWPWATVLVTAFHRLRSLPQPAY